MTIKGNANLVLILLAVFLLNSSIGYAQIQKIKTSSVASELKRRFKEMTLWLEEYIQNFKNIIHDLKTQQNQMKKRADESKRMMRAEMQKFKENQAKAKRQQQDARDQMRDMQMQQRQQMRMMPGAPGGY